MRTLIFIFNVVYLMNIIFILTHAFENVSVTIQWEMIDDKVPFEQINYILYTRANEPEVYNKSTGFKYFQKNKRTKVLIHGFGESPTKSYSLPLMKETLLKVCDCNIIIADWSKYAVEPYYLEASQNTQPIGRTIGDFLLNIGTNLSTTELVAYSLGCHVAGKASSTIGSQIHRIIAFDPALPLFANSSPKYRLDETDAYIVEVVHTCAGILGFNEPIGLRDFWANGGDHPQPGCGQLSPICSHRRSFQYYSEALLNEGRGFKTRRCNSYSDYRDNKCKGQPFLALANHNVNTNLKGNFYFMTNSESPFGKFNC